MHDLRPERIYLCCNFKNEPIADLYVEHKNNMIIMGIDDGQICEIRLDKHDILHIISKLIEIIQDIEFNESLEELNTLIKMKDDIQS